jgi:hypothetical protein
MTMTDDQVRDQVRRADAFIEQLRDAIAGTVIDPQSLCAASQRRTLRRITETLDAVPLVMFANLANLDTALHGALMQLIEVSLMACGGGPDLDFPDAASFLRKFQPMIDAVLKRRIN